MSLRSPSPLLTRAGLLLVSLLSAPATLFAQVPTPAGGVGSAEGAPLAASTGTMIAAAMETVGYHAQSQILANLSDSLQTAGALVFVGVVLSALITVAMLGQYRQILWLLVGPPVFFVVSGIQVPGVEPVRAQADGAEWRFGAFRDTENWRDRYISPGGTQANVSMVFHQFNVLVSEGMQLLIEAITRKDIARQMIFTARQRTVEDLFGEQLEDAGSMALAAYMMVECATEIGDARTLAIFKREVENNVRSATQVQNDPIYQAARLRYCERFPRPDKQLSKGPWLSFVYKLPENLQFTVSQADNRSRHVSQAQLVSCEDMWRWTVLGAMNETTRSMETWSLKNFPWYSWRIYGTLLWNKALKDISDKFFGRPPEQQAGDTLADPCPMASNVNPFGLTGVSNDDVTVQLMKMASALMLRKVMTAPPNQQIFDRTINGRNGIAPLEGAGQMLSTNPTSRRAQLERQRAEQVGEARRYEAYTFINLAPYVQGYMLYVLALIYPFFTLMIIVPGQAGHFLTWMALWVWVKSWDVGWAMIMVADEIAWELLPKHGYFNPDNEQAFSTPVNLLEGAYSADPAYSVAGYWTLLASMVMAVPIITGHAVLGSKRAIAGRLFDGAHSIGSWAQNFGDSAMRYRGAQQVGAYTRQGAQASAMAQLRRGLALTAQQKQANDNVDQRAGGIGRQHLQNIPAQTQEDAAALSGAIQNLWGLGQEALGSVTGNEGMQQSGRANQTAGQQRMAENDPRTNPRVQDTIRDGNMAVDAYAHSRIYPAAAGLLPDRFAKNWMYGRVPDSAVPGLAKNKVFDEVMKMAGIDQNVLMPLVADPVMNQKLNEAFRLQLYRRAHGGFAQTDAEIMALVSGFGLGKLGGPVGLGAGALYNVGYISQQQEVGYAIIRDANLLTAQIQLNMHQHHHYESTYDRRFFYANEAEAYLSEDRGGEFFAVEKYDPDMDFHLARALERSDMNWHYEINRGWGNQVKWTFQPLMWGTEAVKYLGFEE